MLGNYPVASRVVLSSIELVSLFVSSSRYLYRDIRLERRSRCRVNYSWTSPAQSGLMTISYWYSLVTLGVVQLACSKGGGELNGGL
jgi:hypothetical protein